MLNLCAQRGSTPDKNLENSGISSHRLLRFIRAKFFVEESKTKLNSDKSEHVSVVVFLRHMSCRYKLFYVISASLTRKNLQNIIHKNEKQIKELIGVINDSTRNIKK